MFLQNSSADHKVSDKLLRKLAAVPEVLCTYKLFVEKLLHAFWCSHGYHFSFNSCMQWQSDPNTIWISTLMISFPKFSQFANASFYSLLLQGLLLQKLSNGFLVPPSTSSEETALASSRQRYTCILSLVRKIRTCQTSLFPGKSSR